MGLPSYRTYTMSSVNITSIFSVPILLLLAAAALSNIKGSLQEADLSDIIAGRPEEEALAALNIICGSLASAQLQKLNLSDNALGEKGIRACASALTTKVSGHMHQMVCACKGDAELP